MVYRLTRTSERGDTDPAAVDHTDGDTKICYVHSCPAGVVLKTVRVLA